MIFIGDDVEICFEKGGECVVRCQDVPVAGVQEIELHLVPNSRKRLCRIFPLDDKAAYAQQLLFASEMVKAGFSVVWSETSDTDKALANAKARREMAEMIRSLTSDYERENQRTRKEAMVAQMELNSSAVGGPMKRK